MKIGYRSIGPEYTGEKPLFKNVARDIVYLPVYYTSDGLKPLASPFLLDTDGKVIVLKGDTLNRQQLKLYRKYPPSDNAYAMGRRIVGGKNSGCQSGGLQRFGYYLSGT